MKRTFIAIGLALLSSQALAVNLAGIDFLEVANTLDAYSGSYVSNVNGNAAGDAVVPPNPIIDGNAASWVMSGTDPSATLGCFLRRFDAQRCRQGSDHPPGGQPLSSYCRCLPWPTGASASGAQTFSLDSTINTSLGYTGFNSVTGATTLGIYAMNIHLAGAFSGITSFDGVRLGIGGASAVPSLVGAYSATPVPVPAAVWLFGVRSGRAGRYCPQARLSGKTPSHRRAPATAPFFVVENS